MKKHLLLFSICLSGFTTTFAQLKPTCEQILQQEPGFITNKGRMTDSILYFDKDVFMNCGKLKNEDFELLNGPFLGSLLIKLQNEQVKPSYQTIIDQLYAFKKSPEFEKMKEEQNASAVLESRKYSAENWEEDTKLFKLIGFSDTELIDFHEYLKDPEHAKVPYRQAYKQFKKSQQPQGPPTPSNKFSFEKTFSWEAATADAHKQQRSLLLYFNCYACVNARKMEEGVLNDEEIKDFIADHYVARMMLLDDQTKLPGQDPKAGKKGEKSPATYGEKLQKLEMERFKKNTQPYFVIVDLDDNVLSEIGYTGDKQEFLNFLKKGVGKK